MTTGKIYEITSSVFAKRYIGSTKKYYLSNRMSEHRAHFRSYLLKDGPYMTSFEVLRWPDAEITLLEEFPFTTMKDLRAREEEWIQENISTCVNKLSANRTQEGKKAQQKEASKRYRDKHKAQISAKYQIWSKKYREENKELLKERRANRADKIKANKSIPIYCGCGVTYKKGNKWAHVKSAHHINWQNTQ